MSELVLVNSSRRGIGKSLCDYFLTMVSRFIIYFSCNV